MEIDAICIVACRGDAQRNHLRKIPKQSRWCHDVLEGDDIKICGVNIARRENVRKVHQWRRRIAFDIRDGSGMWVEKAETTLRIDGALVNLSRTLWQVGGCLQQWDCANLPIDNDSIMNTVKIVTALSTGVSHVSKARTGHPHVLYPVCGPSAYLPPVDSQLSQRCKKYWGRRLGIF
eukprot:scaffold65297_cov77-Cyclotella_meneghiniana.AAC.4